jgi:hypothetical protein
MGVTEGDTTDPGNSSGMGVTEGDTTDPGNSSGMGVIAGDTTDPGNSSGAKPRFSMGQKTEKDSSGDSFSGTTVLVITKSVPG